MNLASMQSIERVYLASASPRRAELLGQIGVKFEVLGVSVDEARKEKTQSKEQESVETYVARLALEKANAGFEIAQNKEVPVLGADTVVYVDGELLGKPKNFDDTQRMLRLLSGKTHQVLTAVAVVTAQKQRQIIQQSFVTMREISDADIVAYWQTEEPKDKAGSYAIQGKAAVFIANINGSYSGVMGLPLFETAQLLSEY